MSNESQPKLRPRTIILACSWMVVILFASFIIADVLDRPIAEEWFLVAGLCSLGAVAASFVLVVLRLKWLREFFLGPYAGRVWRPRLFDVGTGLTAGIFGASGIWT